MKQRTQRSLERAASDKQIAELHQRIRRILEAGGSVPDHYYACVVLSDLSSIPFQRVFNAVVSEDIGPPAADSFADIRAAIARIKAEETPMCPMIASRLLYDCLRSPSKCPSECPHTNDWIGPENK